MGPLSGEFNGSAHTSHPWLGGEPLLVFGKSHGSQRTSLRMQILIKVQMCLFSRFRTTACTMNLIQSNTEFVNIVCSWSSLPAKDPLIAARNTVFFRTVELAYNQGIDISWGECQVRGDMAYVVVQRHVKRSLNMFTLSELLRDCSFSFVLCNMEPGRLTWKPWIFFSRCFAEYFIGNACRICSTIICFDRWYHCIMAFLMLAQSSLLNRPASHQHHYLPSVIR